MRKRRGRLVRVPVLVVGAMLATVALVACGSAGPGPVVLNFYIPADGAPQYAQAAADCSRASGGRYTIQTTLLPKSADDQRLQLARRLVAGDPALDVMALDVTWPPEFAEAGWIRPFPDDVAAQVRQGTLAGPYDTGTYRGRLYAAPLNTNTELLWYRKDLVPDPPRTWDEMIRMADGLAARGLPHYIEVQGAQYEGLTVWFNTLLSSAGGSIVSENGDVALARGDAARRAVTVIHDLATSPAADPSLSVSKEDDGRLAMEAGQAAFEVNYPFVYASMYTQSEGVGKGSFIDAQGRPTSQDTGRRVGDVFGWTAYPEIEAGKPARVTIGGLDLAVSTSSRHPAEAFVAAQCLRDEPNQLRNAVDAGVPPTLAALYDNPSFQRKYPEWRAIRAALQTASVRPKTPAYQSISTVISDHLNPPAQIAPDTVVGQLTQAVRQAVNSQGLVP